MGVKIPVICGPSILARYYNLKDFVNTHSVLRLVYHISTDTRMNLTSFKHPMLSLTTHFLTEQCHNIHYFKTTGWPKSNVSKVLCRDSHWFEEYVKL